MRMKRELKLIPGYEERAGIYHVVARTVWKTFLFGEAEKEYLRATMRNYEAFCGVRVLTYCLMSNHFHILVEVPAKNDADLLLDAPDEVFLERLGCIYSEEFVEEMRGCFERSRADAVEGDRQGLRNDEGVSAGELSEVYIRGVKARYTRRMCDLSEFVKSIKQRFTQWYNTENGTKGTLWEGRFKSELVQRGYAAQTVAGYIDLNPLRAGMVEDPKDYRWCGYGEALAGVKEAQLGLLSVMQGVENVSPNMELLGLLSTEWKEVMDGYRMVLAVDGVAADQGEDVRPIQGERKSRRRKKQKGFSREESTKIVENGGKLSRAEMLRCRVRYFSDGVVLGSREFVNDFFKQLKAVTQSEAGQEERYKKRETGARKIRHAKGDELFSMRRLEVDDIS
ncbi:MAG: transposase [Akkermansiaceae bacterium]